MNIPVSGTNAWRKNSTELVNPWRMARLASIRRKTLRAPASERMCRQYGLEVSQFMRGSEKKYMMTISRLKNKQLSSAQATQLIHKSCHSPMNMKMNQIEIFCVFVPPSGMYMYLTFHSLMS